MGSPTIETIVRSAMSRVIIENAYTLAKSCRENASVQTMRLSPCTSSLMEEDWDDFCAPENSTGSICGSCPFGGTHLCEDTTPDHWRTFAQQPSHERTTRELQFVARRALEMNGVQLNPLDDPQKTPKAGNSYHQHLEYME